MNKINLQVQQAMLPKSEIWIAALLDQKWKKTAVQPEIRQYGLARQLVDLRQQLELPRYRRAG